jgi:hypothetical protein
MRLVGLTAAAALLGGGLLAAVPAASSAAPRTCAHQSLGKQVRHADVVFRGVVDKVRPVKGKGAHRTRTYKVTADRVYLSSLVADSVVVTADVGKACAPPTLKQGKRYIFFVTEDGSRLVSTSATAKATAKLTRKVVGKLGSGEQPHKPVSTTATFTTVADARPASLTRLLAPGAALLIVSLLGLLLVGRVGRRAR